MLARDIWPGSRVGIEMVQRVYRTTSFELAQRALLVGYWHSDGWCLERDQCLVRTPHDRRSFTAWAAVIGFSSIFASSTSTSTAIEAFIRYVFFCSLSKSAVCRSLHYLYPSRSYVLYTEQSSHVIVHRQIPASPSSELADNNGNDQNDQDCNNRNRNQPVGSHPVKLSR